MIQVLMAKGPWTNPIDVAIMLWTGSKYSHCGFLLDGKTVVEVTRKGRHAIPLRECSYAYDLFEVGLAPEPRALLYTWVTAKAQEPNTEYDYLAILSIVLRGLFGFRIRLNAPDAEICSEFVGHGGEAVGFKWTKPIPLLTPQDIVAERFAVKA